MSEIGNGHPECDQLLAMVDRDLPRASRGVRSHVKACWKCRAHVEEFQATINDYARYQDQVILPAVPPEPRPWMDLRLAMRQMDESRRTVGRTPHAASRIARQSVAGLGRLAAGGAALACLALAIVLTVRIVHPPSPERAAVPGTATAPPAAPITVPTPKTAPPRAGSAPGSVPVEAVLPSAESPLNIEVRVFAALNRLGADLGEPVDVVVGSDGRIEVGGAGFSPARQAELREALASEPKVAIRFTDPEANASAFKSAQEPMRFDAGRSPLEAPLKDFAGSRGGLDFYANQVLDESDAMLERAHALRQLAERFPESRRSELHAEERATLEALIERHRTAFEEHVGRVVRLVAPVLKALRAPAPTSGQAVGTLEAAQRMDRVLSVIFGVARTDLTPDQLLAELSNASAELAATLGGRQ